MLNNTIIDFLSYYKDHGHSKRSIETLSSRLKEFETFIKSQKITSIKDISYDTLSDYLTSGYHSSHTTKVWVWAMQQLFLYMKTIGVIKDNPALALPYPHIEHKEPKFLTSKQLCMVIGYLLSGINKPSNLRDLIILLFLAFTGIRISSLLAVNIQDINLADSSATVTEKGGQIRDIPLPQVLCTFLYTYLKSLEIELGPLFLTSIHTRLRIREVQRFMTKIGDDMGFNLTCHMFRHTVATGINQVAGIDIAKNILGHSRRKTTKGYIHLNPDIYAEYMQRHPFMTLPDTEV